jgi:hypothetical protein
MDEMATIQTLSDFGWAEVASIAGGVAAALLAFVGVLLTIILKRQGGLRQPDVIKFFEILDTKLVSERSDYEEKLHGERVERIKMVDGIYERIEEVRDEHKGDSNRVMQKIDSSQTEIIKQFKDFCTTRQAGCVGVVKAELEGHDSRLKTACSKISALETQVTTRADRFEKEQEKKWTQQEKVNNAFFLPGKTQ